MGGPRGPLPTAAEAAGLHPDSRLGLPPHPYVGQLREELASEELIRSRSDRAWCWLFLLTFFAIHAARMDTRLEPGRPALAGRRGGRATLLLAIVLAYGIVAPVSVAWRSLTRPRRTPGVDLVSGPRGPAARRPGFAPSSFAGG